MRAAVDAIAACKRLPSFSAESHGDVPGGRSRGR